MMWGNYNGTPTHTIDILDGLRSHYKNLVYIKGCDLTADKVIDPLFTQCRAGKTTGLKGEFWNNTEREGKAVSTQYYTQPIAVTTAGMHNFAPGVKVQDFSARYSTTSILSRAARWRLTLRAVDTSRCMSTASASNKCTLGARCPPIPC